LNLGISRPSFLQGPSPLIVTPMTMMTTTMHVQWLRVEWIASRMKGKDKHVRAKVEQEGVHRVGALERRLLFGTRFALDSLFCTLFVLVVCLFTTLRSL
jgi:hypothetical protein